MRRTAFALVLTFAGCAGTAAPPSSSPASTLPDPPGLSARTAVDLALRSPELAALAVPQSPSGIRRKPAPMTPILALESVEATRAPRGVAPGWTVTLAAVLTNSHLTLRVTSEGTTVIANEAYNPVLGFARTPFALREWELDSTAAARTFPDLEEIRGMRLDVPDDGATILWQLTFADGRVETLPAGEAGGEFPLPSNVPRVTRH